MISTLFVLSVALQSTWEKITPRDGAPPSPRMAHEGALAWDLRHKVLLRYGGHGQSGGGEQLAEMWAFDPKTATWTLKEPNTSPPGVCCNQQNAYDPARSRYIRFPSFSGSHGWQWFREIYLNNSSVWTYDLSTNTWRDQRPLPAPRVSPLRCASWDSDAQVVVVFGGEGNMEGTVVYDPAANTWTRMNPAVQPAWRSGGSMAYDAARKVHILFGAQFTDDPHTWAYDLRKNEWRDMKPEVQPSTDRNDAVLAYDEAARVIVALVRVVDKSDGKDPSAGHVETWTYDAGKNVWKAAKPEREPDGWANRRRGLIYLPDERMFLLENYVTTHDKVPGVDREQQVWTYRSGAIPESKPAAPRGLRVTGASLEWEPVPSAESYNVYRGEGSTPWLVEYRFLSKCPKTTFVDANVKSGTIHSYFVRAVTSDGVESADSLKVRTQPRVVEEVTVSVVSPTEVKLSWTGDATGYHVERAVVEVFSEDQIQRLKKDTTPLDEPSVGAIKKIGPFVRLTSEPVRAAGYTDAKVDLSHPQSAEGEAVFQHGYKEEQLDAKGKAYRYGVFAYRVRAVNALGVESGPSPVFLTIPSSPQSVFSKEDGTRAQLKWSANAEAGLKGYRVYRMEGPKINGPGQKVTRLTADPISATAYTDETAGKDEKRFYIVAVDALGQEGRPSSPAWHYRTWRQFYVPFVGEWHQ